VAYLKAGGSLALGSLCGEGALDSSAAGGKEVVLLSFSHLEKMPDL